jgi:hypothetical protein
VVFDPNHMTILERNNQAIKWLKQPKNVP